MNGLAKFCYIVVSIGPALLVLPSGFRTGELKSTDVGWTSRQIPRSTHDGPYIESLNRILKNFLNDYFLNVAWP